MDDQKKNSCCGEGYAIVLYADISDLDNSDPDGLVDIVVKVMGCSKSSAISMVADAFNSGRRILRIASRTVAKRALKKFSAYENVNVDVISL